MCEPKEENTIKDISNTPIMKYGHKEAFIKLLKEFETLIAAIKDSGCLPMATPFDEKSVDFCGELELPVIKIASSDIADWPLMERVAQLEKPVMISNGGASEKDTDDVVKFFKNRNIELGINHCVSLYPSEDFELELNQIDYLKNRYPDHIIGLSSHEYHDWFSSMLISYGKGARTWERHIDIEYPEGDKRSVSKYCSLPDQVDTWFKAFKKAEEMVNQALKLDENFADALINLGLIKSKLLRFDEAYQVYKKAKGLNPNNAILRNNLGNLLIIRGDIDLGINELKEAIKIDKTYVQAHRHLTFAKKYQPCDPHPDQIKKLIVIQYVH